MKKLLLFSIIVIILLGLGVYLIYSNENVAIVTSNQPLSKQQSSLTSVSIEMKGNLNLIKVNSNEYQLVIYDTTTSLNAGPISSLEPGSFELVFQTSNQFEMFVPEKIYDAVLLNIQNNDLFSISFGKLLNLNKPNLNKTKDGGYILGKFKLKAPNNPGTISLLTEKSKFVDDKGAKSLEDFNINLSSLH